MKNFINKFMKTKIFNIPAPVIAVALVAVVAVALVIFILNANVKTTVDPKYVDGFADTYASSKEVDKNGNIKYEFEKDRYEEFKSAYYTVVKEESRLVIEVEHQYSFYNPDINEIVVGITPEAWETGDESALKAEAYALGESALKYQMNLKRPKGKIDVTYRNANTTEVYFTITVEAE